MQITYQSSMRVQVHSKQTSQGNNADYISKQYAGTGALKTDFTR